MKSWEGAAVTYELIEAVESAPIDQSQSLRELVNDMHAGRVKTLVVIDSNPVFAAPHTLGFAQAMERVPLSLALSIEPNETSRQAHWSLPQLHPYEDWSDARAFDGTATILQPQAQPLFGGISTHRFLGLFADFDAPSALSQVQQTWRAAFTDFAPDWHEALASGVIANSAASATDAKLRPEVVQVRPPELADRSVSLLFRPDPHVWDGRFANNAWLQELPRPLTKLTWDNPLLISPAQGRALGVENGDRVVVAVGDVEMELPAWIMPGQAADCAVALLGFGRSVVGAVGEGAGFDVYKLTGRSDPPVLRKGKGGGRLACTEHHNPMLARDEGFARHGKLADFQEDPYFLADREEAPSLYRSKSSGPAAWGMSIDLNACIGCNACVVACMAENNIPVVGKQEVLREREMHWLRIDRYYEGKADDPDVLSPARPLHALRAGAVRGCLPGRSHRARPRGAERDGV